VRVTVPFAIPPLPKVVGLTLRCEIESPKTVRVVFAPVFASVASIAVVIVFVRWLVGR
jgi:hypothetical protein